jgi:hypothetical protein
MAMKNVSVVLAHGAWADGSSRSRVISALEADSAQVLAARSPLTSLVQRKGPIVLAGHAHARAASERMQTPAKV